MADDAIGALEQGLYAWTEGDIDKLAPLLHQDVRLLGIESGDGNCFGRDQVMRLLRARHRSGHVRPMALDRIDDTHFVVSPAQPSRQGAARLAATRITVTAGRVTEMQQYRSRAEAVRGEHRPPTSPADVAEEAAVAAIRAGDAVGLVRLLAGHPELANARPAGHDGRSLLHIATDWPGNLPNVGASIRSLVAAGADPDVRATGRHPETPLHWAASSDDIEAIDALLDAGAHIDAAGAVVGAGTALADATAFGQWKAARRLVDRGAAVTLWEAATLGLLPRVQQHLAAPTSAEDITGSFWGACHGGQLETAAVLLARGADLNWVGWDNLTPLDAARRSNATGLREWLRARGARSAVDLT